MVPTKLYSIIYAYEEISNKRANYLLRQTNVQSSSTSCGLLTTKP